MPDIYPDPAPVSGISEVRIGDRVTVRVLDNWITIKVQGILVQGDRKPAIVTLEGTRL